MKKLVIEWRYFAKDGRTCRRCLGTRNNIDRAIKDLRKDVRMKGVCLELKEVVLSQSKIPESNIILIDDVPIEQILPSVFKGESECCSCSDLCGKPTDCRIINQNRQVFEEVPTALIKKAVLRRIKSEIYC